MIQNKRNYIMLLAICMLFSNSRIAFTRPGGMIRSTGDIYNSQNRLIGIGVGSEVIYNNGEQQYNGGLSVQFSTKSDIEMAVTASRRMAGSNELGLHFQRKILQYGDLSITAGIHDILLGTGESVVQFTNMSPFLNISSIKEVKSFKIIVNGGLSLGKLIYDPHGDLSNDVFLPGGFVGFALRTPYFINNGGTWFIFEYAGGGPHMGIKVPVTKEYTINFALTNFINLPSFTDPAEKASAAGICLGMGIQLPRKRKQSDINQPELMIFPKNAKIEEINIPYTDHEHYTNKIQELRDSIRLSDYDIEGLNSERMLLNQKILQLNDSTRKMHLYSQVQTNKLNESMQHLSKSLRLMFDNDYKGALDAIDAAIDLSPNLAIAYSRKGAIYYRMGDSQRAAMYWNIALKIDPEFEEIYDMLDALKDNRIELHSIDN